MYVIKNALRNVWRSKGRNILVFVLVLVIAVASCVALSIRQSAETAKQLVYDSLEITATIDVNRSNMRNMMSEDTDMSEIREMMSSSLTLEEMEYYGSSKYVDDYYLTYTIGLNGSDELEPYDDGLNSDMGDTLKRTGEDSDFTIIGYSNHEGMTQFMDGSSEITSGAIFSQDDTDYNCVISYELAYANNLDIGSEIILENPNRDGETYTLTICGIFEDSGSGTENTIYMSYPSVEAIASLSQENADTKTDTTTGEETSTALASKIDCTYLFFDNESYEGFRSDVYDMGLDEEIYTVNSADVAEYEKSVLPLDNLSKYTGTFLIVILIVGGAILIVFNLFSVRERKYEIGVLAAIGMRKGKIAAQFLTETLVITLIAVIIGGGIGATVSTPIAQTMLDDQIEAVESSADDVRNSFGGNFQGKDRITSSIQNQDQSEVEYIDTLSANADMIIFVQLMGIGVLLTLIASIAGVISVLQYEPLKILSERS